MPKSSGHIGLAFTVLAAALGAGWAVSAHGYKQKGIELVHPWIMETAAVSGSVYMKIVNSASAPDRLVAVTSPMAEKADLEVPSEAGQPTATFEVPAGGELILKKSGPHIALGGLRKPLHAYGTLPLSLVFERAGEMHIEAMVEEAP